MLPSVKLTNRSLKMSRNPKRKGSSCYPISSIMFYINDVVKILVSPKKFVLNFPTTLFIKMSWVLQIVQPSFSRRKFLVFYNSISWVACFRSVQLWTFSHRQELNDGGLLEDEPAAVQVDSFPGGWVEGRRWMRVWEIGKIRMWRFVIGIDDEENILWCIHGFIYDGSCYDGSCFDESWRASSLINHDHHLQWHCNQQGPG